MRSFFVEWILQTNHCLTDIFSEILTHIMVIQEGDPGVNMRWPMIISQELFSLQLSHRTKDLV